MQAVMGCTPGFTSAVPIVAGISAPVTTVTVPSRIAATRVRRRVLSLSMSASLLARSSPSDASLAHRRRGGPKRLTRSPPIIPRSHGTIKVQSANVRVTNPIAWEMSHHGIRRGDLLHGLFDGPHRAGAGVGGARVRLALGAGALAHPAVPTIAVSAGRRPTEEVLRRDGSLRHAVGGRGGDDPAQGRDRHLPRRPARPDPD